VAPVVNDYSVTELGEVELLHLLTIFRKLEEQQGIDSVKSDLHNFVEIASSIGNSLEAVINGVVRTRIETLIEQEASNPSEGTQESYGAWKRTNSGFYEDYSKAKNTSYWKLQRLRGLLDDCRRSEVIINRMSKRFVSVQHMISAGAVLNILVPKLQAHEAATLTLISPKVKTRDITLCFKWGNLDVPANQNTQNLSAMLGNYDALRLLSARAAEVAVAEYYISLGQEVTDISIRQLDDGDDQWKDLDLFVGGRPIDVKNARKSFSSPESYVEHCVPRFKTDRKSNAQISIAGVLSDFSSERDILSGLSSCQILGETNVSVIRKLWSWMHTRFGKKFNVDGIWRQGFVPGWSFEYPETQYLRRSEAIAGLGEVVGKLTKGCLHPEQDIPGWILSLCPNREMVENIGIPGEKGNILTDLHRMDTEIGYSRPSLYLYVMGVMLESMLNERPVVELSSILRELIFPAPYTTIPLFLLDTQEYISNLIFLLSRVSEEAIRKDIRFAGFAMSHPSILRGQKVDRSWMTLMAYCGGWRTKPVRVRCGSAPLFFGNEESCPSCGNLICEHCGYCSNTCDLVHNRQEAVADNYSGC